MEVAIVPREDKEVASVIYSCLEIFVCVSECHDDIARVQTHHPFRISEPTLPVSSTSALQSGIRKLLAAWKMPSQGKTRRPRPRRKPSNKSPSRSHSAVRVFARSEDRASYPRRQPKYNPQIAQIENVLMLLSLSRLKPLKTYHEINTSEGLIAAYVVEIPVRLANRATRRDLFALFGFDSLLTDCSLFKPVLASDGFRSLNHLRRLVNFPHLPPAFREQYDIEPRQIPSIFFVLPKSPGLSDHAIRAILVPQIEAVAPEADDLPQLYTTQVPAFAPNTAQKADLWSEIHWPCIFNPASQVIQNAPPLHTLRATQTELDTGQVKCYLDLASRVAADAANAGFGRRIGAVIVDPVRNEVIAAAGDARWWTSSPPQECKDIQRQGEGRPEYHALMRAVAMVAAKEVRRRVAEGLLTTGERDGDDLEDKALTETESHYAQAPETDKKPEFQAVDAPKAQSVLRSDAYLCNGLDIYLTHEPCVCCSMALVHSRLRSCIFVRSMPGTGGLCAQTEDGGLGYGLFWRKELNWRVMTFQYQEDGSEGHREQSHTESFHA